MSNGATITSRPVWDWDTHVDQSPVNGAGGGASTNAGYAAASGKDIVESGSTLIVAGPADLTKASEGGKELTLVPIGFVEGFSVQMGKSNNRIFEIGSKISYLVPGRVAGGISISRAFFDGASLMKFLYAGEVYDESATLSKKSAKFKSSGHDNAVDSAPISSNNMAMNLMSSFFDMPFGLGVIFRDQEKDDVGFTYFENCYASNYQMSVGAGQNVISESMSIDFTKITPVLSGATGTSSTYVDRNIVSAAVTEEE